jgi:hypothetical protein
MMKGARERRDFRQSKTQPIRDSEIAAVRNLRE